MAPERFLPSQGFHHSLHRRINSNHSEYSPFQIPSLTIPFGIEPKNFYEQPSRPFRLENTLTAVLKMVWRSDKLLAGANHSLTPLCQMLTISYSTAAHYTSIQHLCSRPLKILTSPPPRYILLPNVTIFAQQTLLSFLNWFCHWLQRYRTHRSTLLHYRIVPQYSKQSVRNSPSSL